MMDQSQQSTSIFINPKFKTVHINPNFLTNRNVQTNASKTNAIYINPKFKNAHINPNLLQMKPSLTMPTIDVPKINNKQSSTFITTDNKPIKAQILTKTNRKIIRAKILQQPLVALPAAHCANLPTTLPSIQHQQNTTPLVRVGNRKLIRPTEIDRKLKKISIQSKTIPPTKSIRSKYKIVKGDKDLYKIDRRTRFGCKPEISIHKSILPQSSSIATPKRMIITNRKLLRIGTPNKGLISQTKGQQFTGLSANKKLELLNINGVFYKSTGLKLRRQTPVTNPSPKTTSTNATFTKSPSKTRTLFVRGDQFMLSATGNQLIRIENNQMCPLKRIDIGGLTYVAKSDSTFERTDNHRTRNHLVSAKYRSINLLSRNLVKSNVPCAIFRKLGKCKGHESGRCKYVHDIKHVIICPKFLKGLCSLDDCLLSHSVSLAKMPTCKFYLRGLCFKSNCSYLHKKVNDKVNLCPDFLNGYCEKADKCDQRHDYKEVEKKKPMKVAHKSEKSIQMPKILKTKSTTVNDTDTKSTTANSLRYYIEQENAMDMEATTTESHDAKLSRILSKLNRAKANLNFCSGNQPVNEDVAIMESSQPSSSSASAPSSTSILEDGEELPIRKRPKLGKLPSFIPLG